MYSQLCILSLTILECSLPWNSFCILTTYQHCTHFLVLNSRFIHSSYSVYFFPCLSFFLSFFNFKSSFQVKISLFWKSIKSLSLYYRINYIISKYYTTYIVMYFHQLYVKLLESQSCNWTQQIALEIISDWLKLFSCLL